MFCFFVNRIKRMQTTILKISMLILGIIKNVKIGVNIWNVISAILVFLLGLLIKIKLSIIFVTATSINSAHNILYPDRDVMPKSNILDIMLVNVFILLATSMLLTIVIN